MRWARTTGSVSPYGNVGITNKILPPDMEVGRRMSNQSFSTGDKVGWKTSSDEINTYGTVRRVHKSAGEISPRGTDYSLDSDTAPVYRTEIYDPDAGEHTGEMTIHRGSELTSMDSFPDGEDS